MISHNTEVAFNSLIRKQVKKKRKCLGKDCNKIIMSTSAGHRICSDCADKGSKFGHKAQMIRETI